MVLKILMRTRNIVINKVILPGITFDWQTFSMARKTQERFFKPYMVEKQLETLYSDYVIIYILYYHTYIMLSHIIYILHKYYCLSSRHLRIDEEGNPADNNKETRGEIIGHDVERHLPREDQLRRRFGIRIIRPCFNSQYRKSSSLLWPSEMKKMIEWLRLFFLPGQMSVSKKIISFLQMTQYIKAKANCSFLERQDP